MLLPLLASVFLHECGHILVLFLTGGKLRGIRFSLGGITLNAEYPPSYFARIAISLGGPLVGILCFLLFHKEGSDLSLFAEMSFALSLFNLLPIATLDGGTTFEAILFLFCPYATAHQISHIVSLVTTALLWSFSIYLFLFLNGSPSLFFLSLCFFFSLLFS